MSNFSIEFGQRAVSGGVDVSRLRESTHGIEGISEAAESGESGEAKSFGDFLQGLAQEANRTQLVADQKLNEVATGHGKDLHGAVLAMEKADVQFRMLTQVRNKVIEAYREIMRMQV